MTREELARALTIADECDPDQVTISLTGRAKPKGERMTLADARLPMADKLLDAFDIIPRGLPLQ